LELYLNTIASPEASAVGMKLSSRNGFIPIDSRKSRTWSTLKNESSSWWRSHMSVPISSLRM